MLTADSVLQKWIGGLRPRVEWQHLQLCIAAKSTGYFNFPAISSIFRHCWGRKATKYADTGFRATKFTAKSELLDGMPCNQTSGLAVDLEGLTGKITSTIIRKI